MLKSLKGPVLCLVGPPGVGKTSLGSRLHVLQVVNIRVWRWVGVRDEAKSEVTVVHTLVLCRVS